MLYHILRKLSISTWEFIGWAWLAWNQVFSFFVLPHFGATLYGSQELLFLVFYSEISSSNGVGMGAGGSGPHAVSRINLGQQTSSLSATISPSLIFILFQLFFLEIAFAIWDLLYFHMNFQTVFPLSVKRNHNGI